MNRQGFSLLEVVVSMLIFSIVVAGNISIVITANKIISSSGNRLEAVRRAQAVIERLRYFVSAEANNPSGLNTVVSLPNQPPTQIGMLSVPEITGVNSESWLYDVNTVTGSNLKEVTVKVNWTES